MTRFSQWWLRAVRSGYAEAEVSRLHLWSGLAIREKRAAASAVIWGGLIPLVIILGALFNPVLLAGVLIYPIQVWRIAARRRAMGPGSWTYAILMMVAKFAQLQGNLKYFWDCWRGRPGKVIEYKQQVSLD